MTVGSYVYYVCCQENLMEDLSAVLTPGTGDDYYYCFLTEIHEIQSLSDLI